MSQKYYYLILISIFIGVCAPNLFSDGMFMDGLIYADISRNLAIGKGELWKPYFTQTLFPNFFEHPPLHFWLQSICFKVFGDSFLVERFYSLSTFVLTGLLLVKIWALIMREKSFAWIPLLFLMGVTDIYWACSNNILENTMMVFGLSFVFFYLKGRTEKKTWLILFSIIFIVLGFLTKGFTILYLWAFPFFYELIFGGSLLKSIKFTLISIFLSIGVVALLVLIDLDAYTNLKTYFYHQVMGSVENIQTVDSRLNIVIEFINFVLPSLFFFSIIFLYSKRKNLYNRQSIPNTKLALVFLLTTLSGVLPIMISLKQSGFYILTVYPYWALFLAFIMYPTIKNITRTFTDKIVLLLKRISYVSIILAILLSVSQVFRVGRDKELIQDVFALKDVLPRDTIISIPKRKWADWSLHGYMMRYCMVSLDPKSNNQREFFLIEKSRESEMTSNSNYDLVPVKLKKYSLFKIKDGVLPSN